jgi:RNA polymerase-associated protein
MSLRAKTKYVQPSKPAPNAGITLYCSADAVTCLWVRLVLAEKDVEGARFELQKPGRISEDLLLLNPSQTLPTLADRETVIYPARVIAEYLDERYPHPPMMPSEPSHRARLRMALDRLEQDYFTQLQLIETGTPAIAKNARKRLAEMIVSSAPLFPARGWFLGLEHSLVDSAWTALFWRIAELRLDLPPAAEPVRRYAQRAFARTSFQRVVPAKR